MGLSKYVMLNNSVYNVIIIALTMNFNNIIFTCGEYNNLCDFKSYIVDINLIWYWTENKINNLYN